MTVSCPRCKAEFKFQYLLDKHLNRKKQCIVVEIEENNEHQCKYCLKMLKTRKYSEEHESKCKWKNDPIRGLEMKLGKVIDPMYFCKKCRYCETTYCRPTLLNDHVKKCEKKEEYKLKLENELMMKELEKTKAKESKPKSIHIHDVNNSDLIVGDNNTMVNVTINAFGKEDMSHITQQVIEKLVYKHLKFKGDNEGFIAELMRLIHANPEHPENHNVLMQGKNKPLATIYTGDRFEQRSTTNVTQMMIENGGNKVMDVYDENEEDMRNSVGESKYKMVDEHFVSSDRRCRRAGRYREIVKGEMTRRENREMIKGSVKGVR